MNYIVLDLEWNQSSRGKQYTVLGLPFEIIQIGAVKLDENNKACCIHETSWKSIRNAWDYS